VSEPTERQVLYAIVAAAWLVIVGVLAAAAAFVDLSPPEWSVLFAVVWAVAVGWAVRQWRRTGRLLLVAVTVFAIWMVGTLLTR
jgi:hypothetical protein